MSTQTKFAPWLTLDVVDKPTPEQAAVIAECKSSGQTLIVFYAPGDTTWMLGDGPPPWESNHASC